MAAISDTIYMTAVSSWENATLVQTEKNTKELEMKYSVLFLCFTVINAENAAHKSEKFSAMATRTRHEYLKDLATNYVTNTTLETGAKGKGKQ